MLGSVQQVHTPGIGVALLDTLQQITVGRRGVDAGQHGLITLEYLVVQAYANPRQILLPVDPGRPLRGRKRLAAAY